MAIYNNLPVYKTSYDLLLETFTLVKNFSREFKYTLGENLKKEIIETVLNIYRANSVYDKKPALQKARENIEVIRLLFRISMDLKLINLEKFASVNEKIESISKQLANWQNKMAGIDAPKGVSSEPFPVQ